MRNLQLETVISNRYDCLYRAQSNSTVTLRLIYVTYLMLSFPIHELLLFRDFDLYSLIRIMLKCSVMLSIQLCLSLNIYQKTFEDHLLSVTIS